MYGKGYGYYSFYCVYIFGFIEALDPKTNLIQVLRQESNALTLQLSLLLVVFTLEVYVAGGDNNLFASLWRSKFRDLK